MPITGIDLGTSNPAVLDGKRPDKRTRHRVQLRVNGESVDTPVLSDDEPLLWVLRERLGNE